MATRWCCIKYAGSDLEAFVLSFAGMIGLNGLNKRGVAICCNSLGQLMGRPDGLPVACIVREVLKQESEGDAAAFVQQIEHASRRP
jgi:isopenicillin-N N-acyltransferase like protein